MVLGDSTTVLNAAAEVRNSLVAISQETEKNTALKEGVDSAAAALKIAETIESGVIVAIICDRGDRYLSSDLFE